MTNQTKPQPKRHSVKPCDNCGTLPDAPRDRTWDVCWGDKIVHSDFHTRKAARDMAQQLDRERGQP